jgi:hypothetical protein
MRATPWSTGLAVTALTGALMAGMPTSASAQTVPGPENFTIIVAGDTPQRFIAWGTLNITGTAIPVSGGGPDGGVDVVRLPGGTFMLTLTNTSGGGSPVNPVTCVASFFGAGTSTIANGTGAFAGITGTGTFVFHGTFHATRTPQGCSQQGLVTDLVQDQGTLTRS